MRSTAASRKRCTRFSARTRAGSSDRATASSRQVRGASAATSSVLMRRDYNAKSENVVLSDRGLENRVEGRCTAVRHPWLPPDLDRERDRHQRAVQPQEVLVLVGDPVELDHL